MSLLHRLIISMAIFHFDRFLRGSLVFALALFLVLGFNPAGAREAHFTLLFTNDHHGQVDPVHEGNASGAVGGVTRRMALIEKIRKEMGPANVILVDSGDIFTGTALSSFSHGEVDCEAYQMMQYDAVAIGEHDFDYGTKALLEERKKFKIPWISANIVVRSNSQNFVKPYVLKYAGVRVGIIGFSNPDTPNLTSRANVGGLTFNPAGAAAKGLHSILKKDADIFIALSHLGVEADKKFAKDNPFIHVIIGGHSYTALTEPIVEKRADGSLAGPLIVQAGSRGLYLGRLDLTIKGRRDPKTKKEEYWVDDYKYKLIPITADLPEDPQMAALVDKYKDKLKEKPLDEVLATVSGDLTQADQGDSLIGEITADAMREEFRAQVALINNDSFHPEFKSGNLTRENLYEVFPRDEEVVTLDVPGVYLRKILEASAPKKGQGGFLQVSGLKIEKDGEELKIQVGNEPLNDKGKYLVATNGYMAESGSVLLRRVKSRRKTQVKIRELLEKALKAKAKVSPTDMDKRWSIP
ncbi:MAG TPA: bifunctional UDP-sugar hydrolase/5'-nucleotidase [bacterium]|nr:bifunctional UDP-sugar hydrolase/5'-nucleotidase [bacterium]